MDKESESRSGPGAGVKPGPLIALTAVAAAVVGLSLLAGRTGRDGGEQDPTAKPEAKAGDDAAPGKDVAAPSTPTLAKRLVGHWQRVNGGYVIQIRGATPGGKLDAAYFNPNPINVSRAEYSVLEETVRVFVELRDRNYPGATYDLTYDAETDCLNGKYNQPLMGEVFDVSFVRMPEQRGQ